MHVNELCVNFVYTALLNCLHQDSNRRRVYINHDTRMVSLQRPRQEQPQDSTMRTFLPRMHSVEEEEEVKMETLIKGLVSETQIGILAPCYYDNALYQYEKV